MPDPVPFFRGFFQADLLAAAEALCSAYARDQGGVANALSFVGAVHDSEFLPGNDSLPPGYVVFLHDYAFVVLVGTQNSTQAILQIVGSSQTSIAGVPGHVGTYHGSVSEIMYAQVSPILAGQPNIARIVLLGHSLGGAMAEIMTPLLRAAYPTVPLACFTFGAPRGGDATFAAAVAATTFRVEDTDDPIPAIPPPVWAGPGSQWPISGPPPTNLWVHPGEAVTVSEAGDVTTGSSPPDTLNAALLLATGNVGPHYMTEYARRLNAKLPEGELTVDTSGFAHPEFVQPYLGFLLGESMPPSPGLAATPAVYKVYLAYNYGQAGISEEWYSTLSPDTLRTTTITDYLRVRMAMAVNVFEFVYARISNPAKPRWVDFLTANDNGVTRFGTLGANIKNQDLPAVGAEDDGALLSRMKIVGGPSARQFLHAFDQTQTNEGSFTPNQTFIRTYAAYTKFLKNAASGVQFSYGALAPLRLPITTIAAKPIRGFTITPAAATTVTVGQVVYVGGTGRSIVGVTGRKIVTAVPVGGATFDVGGASPVGTYNGVGGYYYLVAPTLGNVDYMQVERLTSHRVGRPFAEPRGRKSNRLSLRL